MTKLHRWLLLILVAFMLAACSSNASVAAGPTGSTGTGASTGATGNTGTAAPTSSSSVPPTTAAPTGNTGNPGYFDLTQVKNYTTQVAANFGDTGFSWGYNKGQGDWQVNTTGNFCMLNLTNSQQQGETSNQVDNIDISCGLPLNPSSVNHNESDEATALFLGVTKQFVSQAASTWVGQEITKAGSSNGAVANQNFGPVAVGVNFGAGQLSLSLLSQGY